jgi:hypothetical protein
MLRDHGQSVSSKVGRRAVFEHRINPFERSTGWMAESHARQLNGNEHLFFEGDAQTSIFRVENGSIRLIELSRMADAKSWAFVAPVIL